MKISVINKYFLSILIYINNDLNTIFNEILIEQIPVTDISRKYQIDRACDKEVSLYPHQQTFEEPRGKYKLFAVVKSRKLKVIPCGWAFSITACKLWTFPKVSLESDTLTKVDCLTKGKHSIVVKHEVKVEHL